MPTTATTSASTSARTSCANTPDTNNGDVISKDMLLSTTSTDLGFEPGHYSHESSMERSLILAGHTRGDLNNSEHSQQRHDVSFNNYLNDVSLSQFLSVDDFNGNSMSPLSLRHRNLSDESHNRRHLHESVASGAGGSATCRSQSDPNSPRDLLNHSIINNTSSAASNSFDLTRTLHSTPTDLSEQTPVAAVYSRRAPPVPRGGVRPPSAPLTGRRPPRHGQRCFSTDASIASG